jgi:hypothetical protein
MASDLSELIERHPSLFRGEPPRVSSHVPRGWFALVDELCVDLETALGDELVQRFAVVQIKEKFGGLRFYFSLDGKEDMFMDFHSPDGARTVVKQAEDAHPVMNELRTVIANAVKRSQRTCMECGELGKRENFGGWLAVLCDRHAAERCRGDE